MCSIQLSSKSWGEWRARFYNTARHAETSLGRAFVQDHTQDTTRCSDLLHMENNCEAEQLIKERFVIYG